jgi:hypothetical protein
MILAGAKLRAELLAAFGVLAFPLTTVGEYSVTRTGPRARWSCALDSASVVRAHR